MKSLGLYLHVPFCSRRCDYCDFYVVVGREAERTRFTAGLAEEIRLTASLLSSAERRADSVYVGGGTPSLLAVEEIGCLIEACRASFEISLDAEITLEANPEGIEAERLAGWLRAGINRLSVGIQTLDDSALLRRGRLHTGEGALRSLRLARAAGFINLSADLIAGLPGEAGKDGAGFAARLTRDARRLLDEGPDHVSLYLLETDKETPLMEAVRAGRVELPPDDEVAEAYQAIVELAASRGYERYEISSFALPGKRSRHNLKYWTGDPYLGFGPAAHSLIHGRRFSAPRDLDAWLEAAPRARACLTEGRDEYTLPGQEARAREALVLNLRLAGGVRLEEFDRVWGTRAAAWVERDLRDAVAAGLVEFDGAKLRITERGVLLANEVFSRLLP